VAAGYQRGTLAGDFATIAKLTRVMMLAPMVLILGRWGSVTGSVRAPMPWFVLGFVGMVIVASIDLLPRPVLQGAASTTQVLLAMALAAMGLETDLRKLRAKGLRPLMLGAAAWAFIAALSLMLVLLIGQR
jgi:uncharacterized membrane protein YadS